MHAHEYAVIGHNRAKIGRVLGVFAGLLAAACTVILTAAGDFLKASGLQEWLPNFVLLPVSGSLAFGIAFWCFDHWAWKCIGIRALLKLPNLSGDWEVNGQTLNPDDTVKYEWTAKLTIYQTWDKIKVHLRTNQSSSDSVAASVIRDPGGACKLMYSYRNQPRMGEPELEHHVGYCELEFNRELTAADGMYFNNLGRTTFGRMSLRRAADGA